MIREKIEIDPNDSPWEIACMIIDAECTRTDIFGNTYNRPFFGNEELSRIGKHLINYCNTEQETEK